MALVAVQNQSLSDQVFEQLAAGIIRGEYAVGDNLPAERTLAEVFQVNRHVVREALKRLEQAGLVKTAQGGGTRVLDFATTAGLDLLVLLGRHATAENGEIWLAVVEMRAAVAVDLVRLCAIRANDKVRERVKEVAEMMRQAASDQELLALDLRFWGAVLEGTGNIAYRLAFNSMMSGVAGVPDLTMRLVTYELRHSDFRREVAAAITAADADRAEADLRGTLQAGVGATREFLIENGFITVERQRKRSARAGGK